MVAIEAAGNWGENVHKVGIFGDLPRALRRLRERAEIDQATAGAAVGKSSKAISHYERGIVSPQLDVVERLLELYGITSLQALAALTTPPADEVREATMEQLRQIAPGHSADYYRGLAEAYSQIAEAVSKRDT